jgi:enediyne biosynthesis protein CalE3
MMPQPYHESNHPALYYQGMLSDNRRMERYREAIFATVSPGDIVVDLGTGLGVLAMFAVQAGAARVYAVDVRSNVLPITRRLIESNGMSAQIILIEGDATEVELPEPVDLIINELIGDFGTDENIQECVAAISRRYLRPGGKVLPRKLSTHIVGVSYDQEFRGVYSGDFHGMNMAAALLDEFKPAPVMVGLQRTPVELTERATLENIHFENDSQPREYTASTQLNVLKAGELQGFVGYFVCELAAGIQLDNYPCYAGCHWVNWHWPVTPAIPLQQGQCIQGELTMPQRTTAPCWNWQWQLESA